jgi:Bacterial PH domain
MATWTYCSLLWLRSFVAVDAKGIAIRNVWGTQLVRWEELVKLDVSGRRSANVRLVRRDGSRAHIGALECAFYFDSKGVGAMAELLAAEFQKRGITFGSR